MRNVKDITKCLYYSTFDGCLIKPKSNNANASLIVNMLKDNFDYIEAVINVLDDAKIGYLLTEPEIYKKDGYSRRQQLRLQSKRHPKLTKIYNRIYINGHKVIDPHMLAMMDEEALAIMFMADGSRNVDKRWEKSRPTYRLHLNAFSYGDLMLIKKSLKDVFGLEVNIRRKASNFDLAFPTAYAELFEEVVSDFILPSFFYKLGR